MRHKRGIESQSALARKAQIDHAALNKWENGRKLPGDAIIRRVAYALDIDPEDLLSITDSEREVERAARHIARAQRSVLDSQSMEDIMAKYGIHISRSMNKMLSHLPCITEEHALYAGNSFIEIAGQVSVPVVGYVPAGDPWPSAGGNDVFDSVLVDENLISGAEYVFGIIVKGNSMTGYGIEDGDTIVVDKLAHWRVGDDVVIEADGQYTLKRLVSERGSLVLQGLGPEETDYVYDEDSQSFAILGVVIQVSKRRNHAK